MIRIAQSEIIISVIFLFLVTVFLDPFMVFMPKMLFYPALAGLLVVFAVFAGFLWREQPQDEREELHRMIAGRLGYLTGAGLLTVAIVAQALTAHDVDAWLVIALAGMIVAKLVGQAYSRISS